MLRARLATAAVAIPALLALILYPWPWALPSQPDPGWPVAVLVLVIAVIGMIEYAVMAFSVQLAERAFTIGAGTLLIAAEILQPDPRLVTAAIALAVAAGLVWVVLGRSDFELGLRDFGVALAGIFYVGFLLPHFVWLRRLPEGAAWVIFVLLIGMLGDSGGYFVGHAIGRHKLMPRVSPGKTVEGALGIIAASLLGGAAAKLIFMRGHSWTELLVLSAVMAIIGQLGDLSESVMKRTFGVKESGSLFPGHGGVLDRIDSLLFPVTFVYYHVALLR